MKAVIAGGRNLPPSKKYFDYLDTISKLIPITHVIHGGCRGADGIAEDWADEKGCSVTEVGAEWVKYGRKAGPIRNRSMAQMADVCILFPGGTGTKSMLSEAVKAGLRIWIFPDVMEKARKEPVADLGLQEGDEQ